MGLRLPDFIIDIGPTVVSGVIVAYVSALAVTKIYRDYNLLLQQYFLLQLFYLHLLGTY